MRHIYGSAGGHGKPQSTRTVEMEEREQRVIEEDPSISIRRIVSAEGIDHSFVWRILRNQQLIPCYMSPGSFENTYTQIDEVF